MEISHPWHPHPLFLGDGNEFEDRCSICKKEFDGNPFYACVDCKYYVHKSCAQLPVLIQHHFHPHLLLLCSGRNFACDSCHKRFRNELCFRCSGCNFNLDVKCALMTDIDTEGKEFITHVTHQHPLTICSKDGDNPPNCFACKKTSSDLIYGCTPCDYFLHKSCAQISTHVLHAMHPQHALSLVVKWGCCDYCGINDHTWKYCCSFCTFDLDVSCLIESAKNAQNSERSCFLCGKQHLDSDSCVDSLYFINQSCIQLPEEIKHEFHSHKPLLLLDSKSFGCDSCHKWFDMRSHYGCEECDFRMDVNCALLSSIQYEESDESIWPVIPHHFKHQHPLKLISKEYDINCSACHTTKLSPIYGCIRCEYFLHHSCLELPSQNKHPLHVDHVLTIQPLRNNFCQICCKQYIVFSFGCLQCLFFIGIECMLEIGPIPTVQHKSHGHLLYLIEKSCYDRCNADNTFCKHSQESCEFKLTRSYSLRCNKCDYNLHFLCGPLPCTIKHQSHLHALKVVDFIVEDASDEYYCDICEEERNPRLCVYYCENCTFFAHVHCVISEIINIFKKNPKEVEMKIAGDLSFENTINPSHDNLTEEHLLDLLKSLNANEMMLFRSFFKGRMLFLREAKDSWQMPKQISSSEDDATEIITDLMLFLRETEDSVWKCEDDADDIILENIYQDVSERYFCYENNILWKINDKLSQFYPDTQYHIQADECERRVIEVEGYKVISDFVHLFKALLEKDPLFKVSLEKYVGINFVCSKNLKSVLLHILCRIVRDMQKTHIGDVTEKQLFTWLYYMKCLKECNFSVTFVEPFLLRVQRSYFGVRVMKFEDEAPDRLDRKIVNLETQIEKLKWYRQQHRPGKIAEESKFMKKLLIAEAKHLKHELAGKGIV